MEQEMDERAIEPIVFFVHPKGDQTLIQSTLKEHWLQGDERKKMIIEGIPVEIILRKPIVRLVSDNSSLEDEENSHIGRRFAFPIFIWDGNTPTYPAQLSTFIHHDITLYTYVILVRANADRDLNKEELWVKENSEILKIASKPSIEIELVNVSVKDGTGFDRLDEVISRFLSDYVTVIKAEREAEAKQEAEFKKYDADEAAMKAAFDKKDRGQKLKQPQSVRRFRLKEIMNNLPIDEQKKLWLVYHLVSMSDKSCECSVLLKSDVSEQFPELLSLNDEAFEAALRAKCTDVLVLDLLKCLAQEESRLWPKTLIAMDSPIIHSGTDSVIREWIQRQHSIISVAWLLFANPQMHVVDLMAQRCAASLPEEAQDVLMRHRPEQFKVVEGPVFM